MSWSARIRQIHRWLSVVFTLAVLVNFAVQGHEEIALTVGMSTLVVLFAMLFTGLYLFALPYLPRRDG
ncbi:MAG TPA: hypothetical protein PKA64_17330 [Myxococcota bacterium]|nr:hypothetical protein [Myxococcota bacterium]